MPQKKIATCLGLGFGLGLFLGLGAVFLGGNCPRTNKRGAALSLQKNEELVETLQKLKKYIRTKMLLRTLGKKLQISWTLLKTVGFLLQFFIKFSNKITLNRAISSSDESIFQMNDTFIALMISSVNLHTCLRSF